MGGDVMGVMGDAGQGPHITSSEKCDAAGELAKNSKQTADPPKERRVGLTADGKIPGEWHHSAKLSDHDIDLIRQLHEPSIDQRTRAVVPGLGYRTLARKFDCAKSTIRDIVKCRRRFARAVRFKTVRVEP